MLIILFAVILGLIPARIAQVKGRDFISWWIYGSLLFLVALIHSLVLKADSRILEAEQLRDGGRRCPHCAEIIKAEARVCRFCGRDLPQVIQMKGD